MDENTRVMLEAREKELLENYDKCSKIMKGAEATLRVFKGERVRVKKELAQVRNQLREHH